MDSSRLLLALVTLALVRGDRYHPAGDTARGTIPPALRHETEADYWVGRAQEELLRRAGDAPGDSRRAKNVVMFLGDGMSVPTLAAARTLLGQRRGDTGEEASLSFENFPTTGLVKTYCVDAQVPDSACTATAYLCGVKANQGTLGVTAAVPRHDCEASTVPSRRVRSLAEWALGDGRDAGLVTTTRVTHASPAGLYAKSANRGWESDAAVLSAGHDPQRCPDIADQLVSLQPGSQLKVILGGGRRELLPNTVYDEEGTQGRRTDGRNLIQEWQDDKASRNVSHRYVWNRDQLLAAGEDPPEYLLGLFEGNHMQYHLVANETTEPTLAELTEVAIRSLSRNPEGFFLFVEGGRIDHAHHDNLVERALDETIELDLAVQRATELLSDQDSLVVVTADHAHVMAYNGYSGRGSDVLGASRQSDFNGVPYMTLSYTNGPGARAQRDGVRLDPTDDDDFRAAQWRSHADVPLSSETHGGDDVAVFAWGAQHAMFSGLFEQSHLPHRMGYAACLGSGARALACSAAGALQALPLAAVALLAAALLALRH